MRREFFNHIGVSFEHPNLYTKLSGYENLRYYAGLFDVSTLPPLEMLKLVGFGDSVHRKAGIIPRG